MMKLFAVFVTTLCVLSLCVAYELFERVTSSAPWQARNEAGIFATVNATTYQLPDDSVVTLPGKSIVFYGGVGSGTTTMNDVWITSDAIDWFLIGGVSRATPPTDSAYVDSTFVDRSRTCDTYDLFTGAAYLLAGNFTAEMWSTRDGSHWTHLPVGPMSGRERPACSVDKSGVIYMLGGTARAANNGTLNDVWISRDSGYTWIQQTTAAAFGRRRGHDSIAYYSPVLKKNIVMVTNGDFNDQIFYNDVYASSDTGLTWTQFTDKAAFVGRYDSEWKYNYVSNAMIIMGGDSQSPGANLDDLYASLDGGQTWGMCANSTGIGGREDASAIFDANGYLVVMAGGGNDRDVYRSTFSFNNITAIATYCHLEIPPCGTGLQCWPGQTCECAVNMWSYTQNAPWESRVQATLSKLTSPQTYTLPTGGGTVTMPAGSLVLFGGVYLGVPRNDGSDKTTIILWSTYDLITWNLIGGTSKATMPWVPSADSANTFRSNFRSCNTYDPTSGRAYLLAGSFTSNVWTSQDMAHWTQQPNGTWSGRQRAACAVDGSGLLYLIGGNTLNGNLESLTNNVYTSGDNGVSWTLRTSSAAFSRRRGHESVGFLSAPLNKQVVLVTSGYATETAPFFNDVYATSDSGVTWALLTQRAPFAGRYDAELAYNERSGVLLIIGGDQYIGADLDDIWATLDGGWTWSSCDGTSMGGRQLHSAEFDDAGYLVVAGGGGTNQDVWRSAFSFDYLPAVIAACHLTMPPCGTGMRCWPGSTDSCCAYLPSSIPSSSAGNTVHSGSSSSSVNASSDADTTSEADGQSVVIGAIAIVLVILVVMTLLIWGYVRTTRSMYGEFRYPNGAVCGDICSGIADTLGCCQSRQPSYKSGRDEALLTGENYSDTMNGYRAPVPVNDL